MPDAELAPLPQSTMDGHRSDASGLTAHDALDLEQEAAPRYHRHDAPATTRGDDSSDSDHKPHRRGRCCVRYGRTWLVCSVTGAYGYFPLTAHVGPNWPFMLITYALAIGPLFLVLLSDQILEGFRIALLVSSIATTVVFSMVACSDPGVIYESYAPRPPPNDHPEAGDAGIICAQCQIRRPKDASHCSDCNVCVRQLDHHCPWTGKCIGQRTLYLFYLFLWCISIHIVILSIGATMSYLQRK